MTIDDPKAALLPTTEATTIMSPLDDAFCAAYPIVVDAIINAADHGTRIALWGVNQALHDPLNQHFYKTFVMLCSLFTTAYPESGIIPPILPNRLDRSFPALEANLERYCRIFDIDAQCELPLATTLFASARNATALRVPGQVSTANFTPLPSTVVIKSSCASIKERPGDWENLFCLTFHAIRHGPKRVVINCQYAWADQLFACDVGFKTLPSSVTELVFHFKDVGNSLDRPRYWVCQDNGDHSHRLLAAYSPSDPIPHVMDDEHLNVISFPVPKGGESLFKGIAKLYAKTIGKGNDKPARKLKLTVIGLDEFDASRDADAAADEHFASIVHTLPWGPLGSPPRSDYKRPNYTPVAPKFIDEVTKAVHKTKRDQVKKSVRVLTADQYLAELSAQRREEEDWWFRGDSGTASRRGAVDLSGNKDCGYQACMPCGANTMPRLDLCAQGGWSSVVAQKQV